MGPLTIHPTIKLIRGADCYRSDCRSLRCPPALGFALGFIFGSPFGAAVFGGATVF